ncbi:MAG TPA: SPOR domain-containing protein [Gemmatimonadota bacterium]|nr:SPOR domain-containing protein [Gemmatimonadota bacterium]
MTDGRPTAAEGWLPDEARVIALVRDRGSDDWAAGVAIGLADMVGRERGRTFLANAAGDSRELDRRLDAAGPGLTSALTGAATIASIAHTSAGQRFAYLPAGEGALPFSGLRRMRAFRRFVAKVREGGGTMLLYLGEEDLVGPAADRPAESAERLQLDGCIALGDVRGVAAELGAPLLARVERPAPPPVEPPVRAAAPAADGAETATATEPAGRRFGPLGSLARLLAVPIAALLLWGAWALLRPAPDGGAGGGSSRPAAEADRLASERPSSPSGAQAAEPVLAAAPEPRGFAGPAARYSVLVGSYMRLADAMGRRAELSEAGGLFFVAPTPVRGRIYYRVLAGAFEDRADAASAMADLVEDGRKEMFKEWDIRPVRLAYEVGTFTARDEANQRVRELWTADVPAYVLSDTAEAPLYRVYAGAFMSEEDAEPLGRRLEELGSGAELVARSGIAP